MRQSPRFLRNRLNDNRFVPLFAPGNPSDNNRPEPDSIKFTFAITNWIYARMLDICGRAGIPKGVKRYSENNLTFEYATSTIDDGLVKQIMPKAGVPK